MTSLAVLACVGCTKQQARSELHGPSTLVIAVRQEPIALNPLVLEGTNSYTVSELLYSYLTRYDANGNAFGDLAREVPSLQNGGVSPDGLRLTFHLRHGVRWQDGLPLTSGDVLFSYRAVMNPANNLPERYAFDLIKTVTAPDPYTVVVTMKRSFAPIIGYFFGGDCNYPILPAHLLARYPNVNQVPFNASPVGSGPYRFVRWDRGDRLLLDANATYFAGRPAIEHLILPFITDGSTTINQLHSGEIDAAFLLDAARIGELRALPRHRVVVTPVPYFYALAFNLVDPILADKAVREAFGLAIDRRTITRKITQGAYDADTAMRGLFTWAYDPHGDTARYDPAGAEELLTGDGWIPGPDGIRVKNGKRLRLEISYPVGIDITTHFATVIAAEERAIGIEVTQKRYDRTQYISKDGPVMQGHFQVSLYDYQGSWDPDASWLFACNQRAPNGFNIARYCNPEVDALMSRAAASFDRPTRIAESHEVQRRIVDDVPYYFICQISEVDVVPSNLRGYEPPLLSPFNSVAKWRLENPKAPGD